MPTKNLFFKEFSTVDYVLRNAQHVVIMPHTHPDLDAVGSATALHDFIVQNYHKKVTIACFDRMPDSLTIINPHIPFVHPSDLDLSVFDVAIGCDSVERGFEKIIPQLHDDCVTIIIDHHHDITLDADIRIVDGGYAATCEVLYNFFIHTGLPITKNIAHALLGGIIGDTGAFQHANTTADILHISSDLIRKGASITKIISTLFANRKIETLNLWGKALERTKFYKESGLAVTALTQDDRDHYAINSAEVSNIASMLTTVPTVKAALIIYQSGKNMIKGSLRAEKHANIDVSAIAHRLGGGGHPLASGFSMPGHIEVDAHGGWRVV